MDQLGSGRLGSVMLGSIMLCNGMRGNGLRLWLGFRGRLSAIGGHGVGELGQDFLIDGIVRFWLINIIRHRLFQERYHVLHFSGVS